MKTVEILYEIGKLSLSEQLKIAEGILNKVSSDIDGDKRMAEAAKLLLDEYTNNADLTAFTTLDHEEIYNYE